MRVQFLLALWRNSPLGLRSTSKEAATRGALASFAAMAAYGLLHSLFCLTSAKAGARKLLGPRLGRGVYRLFFNLQSLVGLGAVVAVILSRPSRVVYAAPKAVRPLFWATQAGALLIALWGFKELRFRRFSGIQGTLQAFGDTPVEEIATPEAQAPDGGDGLPFDRGPFRYSRHAIEWIILVIMWATPTLKTNWLGFNIAGTIYMVLGVLQEEKRMEAKGGDAFRAYQKRVALVFGRAKEA